MALSALVIALCGTPAFAQTTGSVEGTITDSENSPLPGATVELRSPQLQGGRNVVSNADGRFRFPAVPPGTYTVTASLSGFKKVERTTVRVNLDATATVPIKMEMAVSQEVVVTGEAPVVDITSTTNGLSIRQEVAQKLPLGRNYASVVEMNPGVASDNAETQGRAMSFTIYGSTSVENQYLVDGVNTTNVIKGFQGKALSQEFIEEVQVKTSGYEAEYGRATGGVINVITKSGGNEFHGDAFGYFDRKNWTADTKATGTTDEFFVDNSQRDREDYGADVGGFFWKDRIWFFGAYNRVNQDVDQVPLAGSGVPTAGQNLPITYHTDIYSGKLTFRLTDTTTLVGTVFGDPETREGNIANFTSTNPLVREGVREVGGLDYSGQVTQLFGVVGLVNARYARHEDTFLLSSKVNDPQYRERVTNPNVPIVYRGGFGSIFGPTNNNESKRDQFQLSGTFFTGSHEIKGGADFAKELTQTTSYFTGGQRVDVRTCPASVAALCPSEVINGVSTRVYYQHNFYTASAGDPAGAYLVGGNVANPKTDRLAFFLQDSWKVLPNLTINAGLRYDKEDVKDYTGATVIPLKDEWQPRLGVAWDVAKDGTSKVSASYGRFYYALPTDINVRAFGAQLLANTFNFDPSALPQDPNAPRSFQLQGGAFTEPVQDEIKGIYQDEWTLGFDKAIDATFAVGVRGTFRYLGRTIEDRCDFDYLYPEANFNTCVILNPGSSHPFATGQGMHTCDGRDYLAFDHEPGVDSGCNSPLTGAHVGEAVSVPEARRQYFGFEVVAKKQISNVLWAQASYIFSQLKGNYDGAARIGNGGLAGQTDPGINADYDYPLFLQNAYGKLILDRPHSFRLDAAYTAPFGLTVGFQGFVRSGSPKNQLDYFNSQYGTEIYRIPRGSAGREDTNYEVNLALSYAIKLNPVTISLFAQGFNLLNQQEVLTSNYDYSVSPPGEAGGEGIPCSSTVSSPNCDFGRGSLRQAARQLRLGARVSF